MSREVYYLGDTCNDSQRRRVLSVECLHRDLDDEGEEGGEDVLHAGHLGAGGEAPRLDALHHGDHLDDVDDQLLGSGQSSFLIKRSSNQTWSQ